MRIMERFTVITDISHTNVSVSPASELQEDKCFISVKRGDHYLIFFLFVFEKIWLDND